MKCNIGITLFLKEPDKDSLFTNGIRQNIILLREMFEKCSNVENSYIINTASNAAELKYEGTLWEKYSSHLISLEQAKTMCDMVVVAHGSLHVNQYEELRRGGICIVKQILGSELSMFNERILFDVPPGGLYARNNNVSAVWISPHFYKRDRFFFETMYSCPTHVGPYIWDPRFINEHVELIKKGDPNYTGLYVPSSSIQKKIATMEPNINMVKTSTMPIVISELLYRKYPDLVKDVKIFGSAKVKEKKDMIDFAKDLDIYKAKKMTFEARYPVVWSLYKHVDILLCHQTACELNYLYLDAAWLGWPVVHNSVMMQDIGWFYPENDAHIAVEHINYIANCFESKDHVNSRYLNYSRRVAFKYMIDNPDNIKKYEFLIDTAFKNKK